MEDSLHRFARLLRLRGVRVSVSEVVDALAAATQPHVLDDREHLRSALRVTLVKDRRDEDVFDEVFDRFFWLRAVFPDDGGHGHDHTHEDLFDTGELLSYTVSDEPSDTPEQGHDHGSPDDIRDYFDSQDMAQQYNLHQEANKVDLAGMTQEITFSTDQDNQQQGGTGDRVQLDVERLHNAGTPGELARPGGNTLDVNISVAQERALMGWLEEQDDELSAELLARLRGRLAGLVDDLPELLARHLDKLMELEQQALEEGEARVAEVERVDESERVALEESIRRIARTFKGGLTHRRQVAPRGRVDSGRTMRDNMRFDGIPFRPVTVTRKEDKPRLVVLADVSMSVRSTSRFTLHLVHGLQNLFAQVRTFAFVAELIEITDLFAEHPVEKALGMIFGGDLLDVDANSDYGAALRTFHEDFLSAVTRRTTVVILGDGRGNGNDPNLDAFEEITRRARHTIWLTQEPKYSWGLGGCDLPRYAELCDRVEVVRDLAALDRTSHALVAGTDGR